MLDNPNPEPGLTIDPDMSPFRMADNAVYLDHLNRDYPNRILVAQRRQPTTFKPDLESNEQVDLSLIWDVIVSATVIRKGRPLTGFAYGHIEYQPDEELTSPVTTLYITELAADAIKNLDRLLDQLNRS